MWIWPLWRKASTNGVDNKCEENFLVQKDGGFEFFQCDFLLQTNIA